MATLPHTSGSTRKSPWAVCRAMGVPVLPWFWHTGDAMRPPEGDPVMVMGTRRASGPVHQIPEIGAAVFFWLIRWKSFDRVEGLQMIHSGY